jgi:hypothetical protein
MADMEFRGWWISPEGEVFPIQDHFKYLLENPESFGFAKDELAEVQWEPRGENRERYMAVAFQAGWIRVREQKGFTIIQYWEKNESVIGRIKARLLEFGLTPRSPLAVSEVSNRNKYNITVDGFLAPVTQ